MIKDIVLKIGELDLSEWLSKYNVSDNVSFGKIITTIDGIDHVVNRKVKTEIEFTLMPLTTNELTQLRNAMATDTFVVEFTHPYRNYGATYVATMRQANSMSHNFSLTNYKGKQYWKQKAAIKLRQVN